MITVAAYRDSFLPILNKVIKVVPNSKSIPVLNYIRVDVHEDKTVHLTATDLSTSLTVKVNGAKGSEVGSFLIPAADFQTCVNLSPVKAIVFNHDDKTNELRMAVGSTKWLWPTLPVTNFPKIANLKESIIHTVSKMDLIQAFRVVKPAASVGSVRSNLEQIGIRQGYVMAADGVRFHEVSLADTDLVDIALPLPFVTDLQSILPSLESTTLDLGLPETKDSVIVRCGDYTLMTRTKSEVFPDIAHAFKIPSMSNDQLLKVDRKALTGAVSRVGVTADPSTRAVRFRLSGTDFETLRVQTRQRSGSWSEETLPVDWVKGSERNITFNLDYLLNLLNLFDTDSVTMRFGADQKHKPSTAFVQEGGRSAVLNQLQVDWA